MVLGLPSSVVLPTKSLPGDEKDLFPPWKTLDDPTTTDSTLPDLPLTMTEIGLLPEEPSLFPLPIPDPGSEVLTEGRV